jgi:hypothetical protein
MIDVKRLLDTRSLYDKLGVATPALAAGVVRCSGCGRELRVSSAYCIRTGWPRCCGRIMALRPVPAPAPPAEVHHAR